MKVICDVHNERIDSYCPVHHRSCCIRCVLESHRLCEGVGPLKDFISHSKESTAIKDIEVDITDIRSFVEKMIADRLQNKEDITTERESVLGEIRNLRSAMNSKLDSFENELKNSLNTNIKAIHDEIDGTVKNLQDLDERVVRIQDDYKVVNERASNRQAFLSVEYFVSNLLKEDTQLKEWAQDGTFDKMKLVSNIESFALPNLSSLGLIERKAENTSLQYSKTKEKQAQIFGNSVVLSKSLSLVKSFRFRLKDRTSWISGCDITANGNIAIAQYNSTKYIDMISVHSRVDGTFLQKLSKGEIGSIYDVSVIGNQNIAFSSHHGIFVIDENTRDYTHSLSFIDPQPAGLVHGSGYIFFCSIEEGIRKYELATGTNTLIVRDNKITNFSYIAHHRETIFYAAGNTINCCNVDGAIVWKCEDEALQSPRGLTTDKDGYLYVVCYGSKNIVSISPSGKCLKEVASVEKGSVICYNGEQHSLLLCTTDNQGHIYKICDILNS